MKKALSLLAGAAALTCSGAWAQSSLTLYGMADMSLTRVTGYAQGSVTSLNSGHMEGSRWGVKGEEDLAVATRLCSRWKAGLSWIPAAWATAPRPATSCRIA